MIMLDSKLLGVIQDSTNTIHHVTDMTEQEFEQLINFAANSDLTVSSNCLGPPPSGKIPSFVDEAYITHKSL